MSFPVSITFDIKTPSLAGFDQIAQSAQSLDQALTSSASKFDQFGHTVTQLDGPLSSVGGSMGELSGNMGELEGSLEGTGSGMSELAGATGELNGSIGETASGVEEAAGGMEDLASGAEDAGGGMETLAGATEETASGMETLGTGVEDTSTGMEDLSGTTEDTGTSMDTLSTTTEDTGTAMETLTTGVEETGTGMEDLATATEDTTTGMEDFSTGTEDAVTATDDLVGGIDPLNSGLETTSEDLGTAADSGETFTGALGNMNSEIPGVTGGLTDTNTMAGNLGRTMGDTTGATEGANKSFGALGLGMGAIVGTGVLVFNAFDRISDSAVNVEVAEGKLVRTQAILGGQMIGLAKKTAELNSKYTGQITGIDQWNAAMARLNELFRAGITSGAEWDAALAALRIAQDNMNASTGEGQVFLDGLGKAIGTTEGTAKRLIGANNSLANSQEAYNEAVANMVTTLIPGMLGGFSGVFTALSGWRESTDLLRTAKGRLVGVLADFGRIVFGTSTGMTAAAGATNLFGGTAGNTVRPVGLLQKGIGGLGSGLKGLGATMSGNIFGLGTLGIALAAAGAAMAIIATDTWGSRTALDSFGKTAGDQVPLLGVLFEGIRDVGEAMGLAEDNGRSAADAWHAMEEQHRKNAESAISHSDAWGILFQNILDHPITQAIIAGFETLGSQMQTIFDTVVSTVDSALLQIGGFVVNNVVNPILAIPSHLTNLGTQIVNTIIAGWNQMANLVSTYIVNPILNIPSSLSNLGTQIVNTIISGWNQVGNLVKTYIINPILNAPSSLGSIGVTIVNAIIKGWSNIGTLVKTYIVNPLMTIPSFVAALGTTIVNTIIKGWNTFTSLIKTNLVNPLLAVPSFLSSLGQGIIDAIAGGWNTFASLITQHLVTPLLEIPNQIANLGKLIVDIISKGWDTFTGLVDKHIIQPLLNLPQTLANLPKMIVDSLGNIAGQVNQWINDNIGKPFQDFNKRMEEGMKQGQSVFDAFVGAFATGSDTIKEKGKQAADEGIKPLATETEAAATVMTKLAEANKAAVADISAYIAALQNGSFAIESFKEGQNNAALELIKLKGELENVKGGLDFYAQGSNLAARMSLEFALGTEEAKQALIDEAAELQRNKGFLSAYIQEKYGLVAASQASVQELEALKEALNAISEGYNNGKASVISWVGELVAAQEEARGKRDALLELSQGFIDSENAMGMSANALEMWIGMLLNSEDAIKTFNSNLDTLWDSMSQGVEKVDELRTSFLEDTKDMAISGEENFRAIETSLKNLDGAIASGGQGLKNFKQTFTDEMDRLVSQTGMSVGELTQLFGTDLMNAINDPNISDLEFAHLYMQRFEEIQNGLNDTIGVFGDFSDQTVSILQGMAPKMGEALSQVLATGKIDAFKNLFASLPPAVANDLAGVTAELEAAGANWQQAIGNAMAVMKGSMSEAEWANTFQPMIDSFQAAALAGDTNAQQIVDAFNNMSTGVGTGVDETGAKIGELGPAADAARDAWARDMQIMFLAVDEFGKHAQMMAGTVSGAYSNMSANVTASLNTLASNFMIIFSAFDETARKAQSMATTVSGAYSNMASNTRASMNTMASGIIIIIASFTKMGTDAQRGTTTVSTAFTSMGSRVTSANNTAKASITTFTSAVTTMASTGASRASSFASSFQSAMSRVGSSASSAAGQVRSLQSSINSLRSKTIVITTVLRTVRQFVASGGAFIASSPTHIGPFNVSEFGQAELVTVTPLQNPSGQTLTGPGMQVSTSGPGAKAFAKSGGESISLGGGGGPMTDAEVNKKAREFIDSVFKSIEAKTPKGKQQTKTILIKETPIILKLDAKTLIETVNRRIFEISDSILA